LKRSSPPIITALVGKIFMIPIATEVFPQPDSPTRPIDSPLFREKETLSTAWTIPFVVL
jgi:hypothetical protein